MDNGRKIVGVMPGYARQIWRLRAGWRRCIESAMNISVEHIAIPATNPVALKNWYERVLGAKAVWDNGQNPPTCLIALANVWFEIYQADAPLTERGNNKLAGFRHLALRVPSLQAAKAELEAVAPAAAPSKSRKK